MNAAQAVAWEALFDTEVALTVGQVCELRQFVREAEVLRTAIAHEDELLRQCAAPVFPVLLETADGLQCKVMEADSFRYKSPCGVFNWMQLVKRPLQSSLSAVVSDTPVAMTLAVRVYRFCGLRGKPGNRYAYYQEVVT